MDNICLCELIMGLNAVLRFNERSDAINTRSVGQAGRMWDRIAGGGLFPLLHEV